MTKLRYSEHIQYKIIDIMSKFDILRLELEYLGITIEEMEGLFDIKVTG